MCWLLSVIVESQPLLVLSLVPPRAPWYFQLFFDRQSIKARCTLSAPSNPSLMIGGRGMEVDWDKNTHWPTDAALPSKKFPKHQMCNLACCTWIVEAFKGSRWLFQNRKVCMICKLLTEIAFHVWENLHRLPWPTSWATSWRTRGAFGVWRSDSRYSKHPLGFT